MSLIEILLGLNLLLLVLVLAAVLLRGAGLSALRRDVERLERGLRDDMSGQGHQLRQEVSAGLGRFSETLTQHMGQVSELQGRQLTKLTESNEKRLEELRRTVEERLHALQQDNAAKLDQMRQTVDEKLQGTLEKRLGESFRLVSERLEQVQRGLGEMQNLANGVGDLRRVLTNVKTRGTWGEIQLGNLLEQVLTPDQYLKDAATRPNSRERVEFAIRLPGRDDGEAEVLLPIDAKFPREDYERLLDAADRADADAVEAAAKQLEARVRKSAADIRDKYINPPHTTDFAILFLPTEGLYAEVLRRPGLLDQLQREQRVVVAGPTTLAALLNSLQMGFRTLAIQRRSSEVWELLGAVKTEFDKYGTVLAKVQKKLQEAQQSVEDVARRKRAIDRKLRGVEALPGPQADSFFQPVEDERPLSAPVED